MVDTKDNSEEDLDKNAQEIEKEGIDENAEILEEPFDATKINIETKTPSLDTLIKRLERGTIQMNTETYFQRQPDLWDKPKQSRLIESLLIRFPLPAFFFDATDDESWLVVDGLQRLSSIRNFCVDKKLALTGLEFLTHLNGMDWEHLPTHLQRVIEESQVLIYKIMPGTPAKVKFNIFKRVNTGGLTLEPQEIRHALFQGKPATFIAELATSKEFLAATDNRIATRRMLDRDFINRFLCFYLIGYENYKPDLDTFMSEAMQSIYDKPTEDIDKIRQDFKKSMNLSIAIFGKKAFRKIYKNDDKLAPINKSFFDALSVQFALLDDTERELLEAKKEVFQDKIKTALSEQNEFFIAVTTSTGDIKKVTTRHNFVKNLIQEVIKTENQSENQSENQ